MKLPAVSHFLTQTDMIEPVAQYVRNNGVAHWPELDKLIQREFILSNEDLEPISTYKHRYLSNLLNLKSNKTMIKRYPDIVQIRGGFATKDFAKEHNLSITDDGVGLTDKGSRTPPRKTRSISRDRVLDLVVDHYKQNKHFFTRKLGGMERDVVLSAVLKANPSDERIVQEIITQQFRTYL